MRYAALHRHLYANYWLLNRKTPNIKKNDGFKTLVQQVGLTLNYNDNFKTCRDREKMQ